MDNGDLHLHEEASRELSVRGVFSRCACRRAGGTQSSAAGAPAAASVADAAVASEHGACFALSCVWWTGVSCVRVMCTCCFACECDVYVLLCAGSLCSIVCCTRVGEHV